MLHKILVARLINSTTLRGIPVTIAHRSSFPRIYHSAILPPRRLALQYTPVLLSDLCELFADYVYPALTQVMAIVTTVAATEGCVLVYMMYDFE